MVVSGNKSAMGFCVVWSCDSPSMVLLPNRKFLSPCFPDRDFLKVEVAVACEQSSSSNRRSRNSLGNRLETIAFDWAASVTIFLVLVSTNESYVKKNVAWQSQRREKQRIEFPTPAESSQGRLILTINKDVKPTTMAKAYGMLES